MRYPSALFLILVTGIGWAATPRPRAYADKPPASTSTGKNSLLSPRVGFSPNTAGQERDSARIPLIVIDPGHGGSNTGAASVAADRFEKHVTLALAQALETRLIEAGYRVRSTRDRDQYLTLRQRVAMANQAGADLFVSLHTNATETHAQRGYETYVLSPRAMDVDTRALRGTVASGHAGADRDVALLLQDVERGLAQAQAASLARRIQDELSRARGPADNRGVRQESMHVLLGATMPAVLVEVGFVDHALEGRELLQPDVQAEISQALARAIHATLPLPG